MKKQLLVPVLIILVVAGMLLGMSLGLNKIGSCIVVANDAVAQGKINVLAHLVKVENV